MKENKREKLEMKTNITEMENEFAGFLANWIIMETGSLDICY